jgi:hypothetical protein
MPGPGTLVGGALGGIIGEATGFTISDLINAKLFGAGAEVNLPNVEASFKANLAGSAIGRAVGQFAHGGSALKRASDEATSMGEQSVRDADVAVQAAQTKAQQRAMGALEGAQGDLNKAMRNQAEQEATERSLGMTKAQSVLEQTLPPAAAAARRDEQMNALSAVRQKIEQGPYSQRLGVRMVPPEYPPEVWDRLNRAADPTDQMKIIFEHPQRALQFAQAATPAENDIFRRSFAEAYHSGKIRVTDEMRPALEKMGFSGELISPSGWARGEQDLNQIPEMLAGNPLTKQRWVRTAQNIINEENNKLDQTIVEEATDQAKKLPHQTGASILNQIEAAKTTKEKADIALRAFGVDAQQQAGRESAIASIRNFDPNESMFVRRMRMMALRRGVFGVGSAVTGGGVHGIMGTVLIGGPIFMRDVLRAGWLWSIQHSDAAASKYLDAMNNLSRGPNLEFVIRTGIDATIADGARHIVPIGDPSAMEKRPTPGDKLFSPTPVPTTRKQFDAGPMSQDISRKQATAMASARGQQEPTHIDTVQELSKQVATGSPPDVHQALSTGRLSTAEVRALVNNRQANLTGMFDGISLPDALEAFGRGSHEEKELALGALVQKMNDDGRNLPPIARRAMMAQLSRAMQEETA